MSQYDDRSLIEQIGYKAYARMRPALEAAGALDIPNLNTPMRDALRTKTDAEAKEKIRLKREARERKLAAQQGSTIATA